MRIHTNLCCHSRRLGHPNGERATIALIVFILMVLMWGLVLQSTVVLRQFKQELKLVEKRQVGRYQIKPALTNVNMNAGVPKASQQIPVKPLYHPTSP